MNRVGLGLAVGAGYLLGRTKKLKLAVAVGAMVAGKKMNLTPKGIAELVTTQLQNNPQFKEIGDQLRTDFRGVGKAASGALVERQIDALADRLHGRTAQVRDQLSGVTSQVRGAGSGRSRDSEASEDSESRAEYEDEQAEEQGGRDERRGERREPRGERAAEETAARAPAKKAPAKKAAAKKTAGTRSAARAAGARQSKGGGER